LIDPTAVIDPGGSGHKILRELKKAGANLSHIILTHGHVDHIARSRFLQKKTGALALAHPDDIRPVSMLGPIWLRLKVNKVNDGDGVPIFGRKMKVIHTPGHSPGGICLLGDGNLFSGDTLFVGGIGRTDLPGASMSQFMTAIRERLLTLPGETIVWPGHDYGMRPSSTIDNERKTNPWLS